MNPTLLILAAGLSTRYGRLKQLEPLGPGGESLLDYSVFDAWNSGFTRVVLVIRNELEDAFRAHISGRWPEAMEVVFHHQRKEDLPGAVASGTGAAPGLEALLGERSKPWGTAHAVLTARELLPGPFVVLNADDFYGATPFARAMDHLGRDAESAPGDPPTFGLVAYTLRDTLSPHGGVSRGLCEVDSRGWLSRVREVVGVEGRGSVIAGTTVEGEELILTGNEPVSTNFWIFTPAVFPHLLEGFQSFLARAAGEAAATSPGSSRPQPEFLIPSEVNRLLETGRARVRVRRALDPFLGITHPQDREWVVQGLAALAQEKRYPDPLW